MKKNKLQPASGAEISTEVQQPRKWYFGNFDRPFLFLILALLSLGTVMVFSASYAYGELYYNDAYHFARKQIYYLIAGLVVLFVVGSFNWYKQMIKLTIPLFVCIIGLNYLVPLIGYASNGATRWIEVGPINLQPSELLKFGIIIYFAHVLSDNTNHKIFGKQIPKALEALIVVGASVASTIFQQHLSATIIIAVMAFGMMYIGCMKKKQILLLIVIFIVLAAVVLLVASDFIEAKLGHVSTRLKVWEDPFKYMKDEETNDAGWQPAQSLYAIASGGLWGVGLSQSIEKHGYLPEPQNDYIFSILCEEMGFFMALIVIGLFVALVWRGFVIAKHTTNDYCRMVVMGVVIQIALQAALNIAVVTNTIPSTGISLPFFSYGGTSLMMLLGECGIVVSFSRYTYEENKT